ncbi:MAG: hypothetical protein LBT00_11195 [Spirochaetaceae bacterium]|nr:hypothetical protein [Spirochaetaceae bacterium]
MGISIPGTKKVSSGTPQKTRKKLQKSWLFVMEPRRDAYDTFGSRHCEERSGEAIQNGTASLDCFASLAMTGGRAVIARNEATKQSRSGMACKRFALPSGLLRSAMCRSLAMTGGRAVIANPRQHSCRW